jgi:hypothetical protein
LHRYIFNGVIVPHWAPIEVQNLELKVATIDGRNYSIGLTVIASYFSLLVTVEQPTADMGTFKNEIMSIVLGIFDAIGYHLGRAIAARVTTVLDLSTNQMVPFDEHIAELANTVAERPVTVEKVISLTCGSVTLMDALHNLREAILQPRDTGFACYRAVENILQDFREADEDNKRAWERLRESLRIDRSWIEPLLQ